MLSNPELGCALVLDLRCCRANKIEAGLGQAECQDLGEDLQHHLITCLLKCSKLGVGTVLVHVTERGESRR